MEDQIFPFANVDNFELITLVSGIVQHQFPLDVINNLIYDPDNYHESVNANDVFNAYINTFQELYNKHFPKSVIKK